MRERVNILGVGVDRISAEELHAEILRTVHDRKQEMILHVNAHCLNLSYHRPWLRSLLNNADIVFCDGFGVVLAAKILGRPSLERVTYGDEIWRLLELAELHNLSIFFLGARPGVAGKAAARLSEKYPSLNIVGVQHGYFDRTKGSPENEAIIQKINDTSPNILMVGFGMPLQELWLKENWEHLSANVAIPLGAIFDFLSGDFLSGGVRRGPPFMKDNGFEWLARLLIEPRRLWRRYLIGNPLFLLRVLQQLLSERKEKVPQRKRNR
jgi:N-acetylglucosaminyldiphosphoundecaprenol N-acetyl-beta-D-mannosaminyltransferase